NRSDKPESQILRFSDNNTFKDTFRTYKDITENENMQNKTTLNFFWRNTEIDDNILKYTKSITDSDKILNKIEFNFKGTSEKKWKKFKFQIELTVAENVTFGIDNIEEKWNFFQNVII
ncbi:4337_t:CDS:2, partial [Diversispora eburnea]